MKPRPITDSSDQQTLAADSTATADAPVRTVLIVDDEDYILALLQEVLNILGYKSLLASHADQAKTILARQTVDLIITDMDMPGTTGIDLLHHVKQTFPHIPVVLITGYGEDRAARTAREHGADAYLGKPFHIADLRRCISRLISSS